MRSPAARFVVLLLVLANAALIGYAVEHKTPAAPATSPRVGSTSPTVVPTSTPAPDLTVDAARVRSTSSDFGLLFSAASTSVTWHATGGCSSPANLQISLDSGNSYYVAIQPAFHLLALDATSATSGTVIGGDVYCRPTRYVTNDGGHTWHARSLRGVWFAVPQGIYTPSGHVAMPCPGAVVALSSAGSDALVQCVRGVLRSTDDGRTWKSAGLLPQGTVESLSLTTDGHAVLLMAGTPGCHAAVLSLTSDDDGATWHAGECLRTTHSPTLVALADSGRGQTLSLTSVYRTTDYGKTWN